MKDMSAKGNQRRVLLATGIFYPDVGGPATHVRRIAEHLHARGWPITVVAFGDHASSESYRVIRVSRQQGKLLSWCRYAWAIARESFRHDVLYAFDLTTAGVPSSIMAQLLHKPFLLRIGGDPIWERIVEKGKRALPMRAYYQQQLFKRDRSLLYRLLRFVVRSADRVVVYSAFIQETYMRYYGVDPNRITRIPNPFTKRPAHPPETWTFTFIFAGRFVSYKNLERVLNVFAIIAAGHPEARLQLIGTGPEEAVLRRLASALGDRVTIQGVLDQETLFKHLSRASVALGPAYTEFNPNFILEALSFGKPALISRDNGLSVQLPDELQFDPMSDESLLAAMERILDPAEYAKAVVAVQILPEGLTWEALADAHAELIAAAHV